jgi:hypothetical protein
MDIVEMLQMCGDNISGEAAAEIVRLRAGLKALQQTERGYVHKFCGALLNGLDPENLEQMIAFGQGKWPT